MRHQFRHAFHIAHGEARATAQHTAHRLIQFARVNVFKCVPENLN